MQHYPMFVRMAGLRCAVIGGGTVAERKVTTLLGAAAVVTVVSPTLTDTLATLAANDRITHVPRRYHEGDLRGFRVAFAATNDDAVHAAIAREAEREGTWLNVVDRPQWCSFIVPAIVEQGDLTIAISTGGASPALARQIRTEVDRRFGPEYAQALTILRAVRERLRAEARSAAERRGILTALVRSGLVEYLRTKQGDAIDRLLGSIIGHDVSMSQLGVHLD